jgi:hypothetical protein
LFVLKAAGNEKPRKGWLQRDEPEKRVVLRKVAALPLPRGDDLQETFLKIEWFMSAEEICALLEDVAELPALHINPGLADAGEWQSVAFKGGSETGVLNFSTRVVAEDGASHCVVATWNNETALDPEKLSVPYRGILGSLRAPED